MCCIMLNGIGTETEQRGATAAPDADSAPTGEVRGDHVVVEISQTLLKPLCAASLLIDSIRQLIVT